MSTANYRTLLRTPGAAAFFLPAAVGRVGLAMTGLGIVWLVHDRTGSYGAAGIAVGCFAVADALGGPQVARVVDLLGQRRVLPYVLAAHAVSVGLLLVGGPVLDLVAATLVGVTLPQLSALSAACWSALLRGARDEAALPKAFALEALANALSYLAGPALVSTAGAAGRPELGTLLAAVLVGGGGLAFAVQRRTAPPVEGRDEHRTATRALLRPAFARQVAFTLALGVFFGAMQVSVTAYAVGRGTPDSAPLLYAVSNCTSLLAGWVYGLRTWRTPAGRQRALVAAGLAAACLPLTILDAPLLLSLALALTGFAVPPLLVLSSVLAESMVPRAALTQAFTWLNSASAAGSAGAAAVAGQAVDAAGAHGGFAVAAAATAGMAVLAAVGGREVAAQSEPAAAPER
ncbi:MFS transporter [Streptomyces sp. NBC_00269]|uniref:MFS transporter n=1 Tax=Streptomyces sp. NBC_00269 TaxID=2975696 RepID=UPI002E28E9F3|nr:MFS transporter [Streptomyces sp. NBC_00269]